MTVVSYRAHDVLELGEDTKYSVTITNNSKLAGHKALIFQEQPDMPKDVHTLAWLVKTCHPGTQVGFFWDLKFNFVWGQQGELRPGVNYQAGQVVQANLVDRNVISLLYIDDGFLFGATETGTKGALLVDQDKSVPGSGNAKQGCVGIGMSGAGTFVVPTEPKYKQQFDPHPAYWIAFGKYAAGDVVDQSGMTYPERLEFAGGNFNANCSFDGSGWSITYS
ncbi:hypothetical protein [Amycolatopsis nigrescens]|uniref:hypothetical protein n=1 Tax=Amycolatopsis nigrescens TaxID=381445 RepID=UPI0003A9C7A6|nr:hypothetical protein [Amycolatopsis nigrescens]